MGQWISKQIPPPADDPPSDPPQVFEDALSTNDMIKQDVMAGLSLVPEAGSALDLLVSIFWPDSGGSTAIWDQIAAGVKAICSGLINQQMVKDLGDKTEGLYGMIDDYRQTSYGIDQKGEKFTILYDWFIANKASYLDQADPLLTLQYFVPMATLHLTVLREQWLYWDKIYPNNPGADTSQHLATLQKQMAEYVTAADDIKDRCLTLRNGHISRTDWMGVGLSSMGEICKVTDDIRGITHTVSRPQDSMFDPTVQMQRAEANVNVDKYYQNLLDYVDQVFRQQIEDLLAPSLQWPYFDNTGSYPVIKQSIRTTTGTMCNGLSQYMVHFNHRAFREQHGPITRIELHGGDWVDGIEIFYGGVSSGLQGKASDSLRALDIASTEGIAEIAGNVGDKLDAIQFIVNPGKCEFSRMRECHFDGQHGICAPTFPSNHTIGPTADSGMTGTGAGLQIDPSASKPLPQTNFFIGDLPGDPLAFVGWKLDYLFGWGNPVDGRIEQFGAVFAHDEVVGKPIGLSSSNPTAATLQSTTPHRGSTAMASVDTRHKAAQLKNLGRQAREKFLKERLAKEPSVK